MRVVADVLREGGRSREGSIGWFMAGATEVSVVDYLNRGGAAVDCKSGGTGEHGAACACFCALLEQGEREDMHRRFDSSFSSLQHFTMG